MGTQSAPRTMRKPGTVSIPALPVWNFKAGPLKYPASCLVVMCPKQWRFLLHTRKPNALQGNKNAVQTGGEAVAYWTNHVHRNLSALKKLLQFQQCNLIRCSIKSSKNVKCIRSYCTTCAYMGDPTGLRLSWSPQYQLVLSMLPWGYTPSFTVLSWIRFILHIS